MLKTNHAKFFFGASISLFAIMVFTLPVHATTFLQDDFTGTTIDTSKWTEVDSQTGGTVGDVQQNGTLTVRNSNTPSTGSKALVSVSDFGSTNLEVSAVLTNGSNIIGYGDREYDLAGNKAYLLYLNASNELSGLVWNNAAIQNNVSCGVGVSGATYKMKVTGTGFEIYQNGSLACTVTPNSLYLVDNKPVFFQGISSTPSTFDDALVIGDAPLLLPGTPTSLVVNPGVGQLSVSWTAPSLSGFGGVSDYLIEYKLSTDSSWTTFADGTSASTSTSITSLTNDLSYDVRVSAVNTAGTGPATSPVSGTPSLIVTFLSDSFTGTTIDTSKWTEIDSQAGGTVGDIQQNGVLTIANSNAPSVGSKALVSVANFSSDYLEISAAITSTAIPMIGYGDRVYNGAGNKAYLMYIASGGNILGLVWNNASLRTNVDCGTRINGATYKMKVSTTGFQVYRNGSLVCTVTPNVSYVVTDKPVFFAGDSTTSSTFDNALIVGKAINPIAPTSVTAVAGNALATVNFNYSNINNTSQITTYTVTSSPGGITATGTASPIVVSGLTNGTPYTFTVTTTNPAGVSAASSSSNSVTPTPPSPPNQVTGVSGLGVNRQVLLGWDTPGTVDPITDYTIEYKLSSDSSWTTFTDGVSTNTTTTVTGLTNSLSYDFRVSAINIGGAGTVSSTTSVTPAAIANMAFVFTGESNSGGQAANTSPTSEELAPTSEVQILNNTSLLFEDLDIGTNNNIDHSGITCCTTHGFELGLANSTKQYAFTDISEVFLVKTGQGGSRLSQWDVGQTYWTKFLQRTAAAKTQLPSPRQWVVWMSLGINDFIFGTSTSAYKTAMLSHINKIRADLPGAIVVMTQFQSMTANSGYSAYNTAMAEIAANEEGVYVVDSTGAALDDPNHWSYSGLKTMEGRMVTSTNNALGLIYPGVPTNLDATAGEAEVALSWTAPSSNGGSSITDYTIEYKLSSDSSWTTFTDGVSTNTTTTVTGLTNSLSYDFRVLTANTNGVGEASSTDTATPIPPADTTSPSISLTTPSNATVVSGSIAVSATASDNIGVSGVQFKLDGSNLQSEDTTSTYGITWDTTSTSDGSHTLTAVARDAADNTATSSSVVVIVDNTAPVRSSLAPTGTLAYNTTSTNLTLSTNETAVCKYSTSSGTAYGSMTAFGTTNSTSHSTTVTGLTNATSYTYYVKCADGLSNTNATDATISFAVAADSDAPLISSITATSITQTGATITWTTDELASSQVSYGTTSSYGTTTTETDTSPRVTSHSVALSGLTANTTYHYQVISTDGTTNTTTSTDQSFTTSAIPDTTPPDTFLTDTPSDPDTDTTPTFTFEANEDATFECSLDAASYTACVSPYTTTTLAVGPHTLNVRATDTSSNTDASPATYSWTIEDEEAPTPTPSRSSSGSYSSALVVRTPSTDTTACRSGDVFSSATGARCTSSTTPSTLPTFHFTRSLSWKMTGEDVRQLQIYLNTHGYPVAPSGVGSRGKETTYFGLATKAALIKFQAGNKIVPSVGFFGPVTRAFVEAH